MLSTDRPRIGEILRGKGFISEEQIQGALAKQRETGGKLGEIFIGLGFVTEDQMVEALALQLGIPRVQLPKYLIEPEVLNLVPAAAARRHRLVPLFRIDDTLTVAMADPLDVYAVDEIKRLTGLDLDPMVTTNSEINEGLRQHYGVGDEFKDVIANLELRPTDAAQEATQSPELLAQEAPIIKLVNTLMSRAVAMGASDIHFEPTPKEVRVRFRIDGILQGASSLPIHSHAAVVSRIKIMADLDIAEKRIPQDGRLQISIDGREVDMRISTYPTISGEKVVVRVLDTRAMQIDLDGLGLEKDTLRTLERAIAQPTGIVLLTGPTGSGKTTTLYAAMQRIACAERNIMTIEDPIEYYLESVNQSQINLKAGLNFATGLRAILRQDPDVIMVGEIRDQETAEIAVRAAMTGHVVFSTLHTNDAVSALTRLIDLGLEPYLPASTVSVAVAQRLIRRVCEKCAEPYQPEEETLEKLDEEERGSLSSLRRGKGCGDCGKTGYRGRTGMFEILEMSRRLQDLLSEKVSSSALREQAIAEGMRTLRQDGLQKAGRGVTTLEEVLRVS